MLQKTIMEKFCSSLGEHVTTILNFEKEKTVTVNNKKMLNIIQDVINFYICEKRILQSLAKNKKHQNRRDHCYLTGKYRGGARSICNLKFNVSNETL